MAWNAFTSTLFTNSVTFVAAVLHHAVTILLWHSGAKENLSDKIRHLKGVFKRNGKPHSRRLGTDINLLARLPCTAWQGMESVPAFHSSQLLRVVRKHKTVDEAWMIYCLVGGRN